MRDYFSASMCWSALGFIVGYTVCLAEVTWREWRRHKRDHT